MPIDSMLPLENTSPGVPRTGGYAPAPDEALRDYGRQRQWAEMARYARLHDPTVSVLTAMAARNISDFNEKKAGELMKTDSMKLLRELVSVGSSWGMLGGNPVQLMAGVQQFGGASQFRVGSNTMGGQAQLFGGGAISDMFGRQLFDRVQRDFMSPNTGFMDRSKSFGFDKGQVGDIFALMGSRRMFSGANIGDMNFDKDTRQYKFQLNEVTTSRITKTFEETAKLLANVRDIVGNRSIGELAQIAEQVAGVSMRGSSSPTVLNNRLERLRNISGVMGIDKESFLQAHMATTAMGAPVFGRSAASSMSMNAWDRASVASLDRNASVARARGAGKYRYGWDEQELAQIGMKDQMQALAENPILAEAIFAQQNINGPGGGAINKALASYGRAGSSQDRIAATQAIAEAIKMHTGQDAGTLWRELGPGAIMRGLSPESNDQLSNVLSSYSHNMNRNVLRRYIAKGVIPGATGDVESMTSAAFFFKRGLDADQQQNVIEALEKGGGAGVRSLFENDIQEMMGAGLGGDMQNFLGAAAGNSKGFGSFLRNMQNVTQGDRQLANMESVGARRRADEKSLADWYWSNMVGETRLGSEGMLMDFARGLVGGTSKIDNQTIVGYMRSRAGSDSATIKYSTDGTFRADAVEELSRVLDTYDKGGLAKALGLGADATSAEMAAAMSTTAGRKAQMEFMRKNNVAFSPDADGMFVLGKQGQAAGRKALELGQRVYERGILTGTDINDPAKAQALNEQIIAEDRALMDQTNPAGAQAALSQRGSILSSFFADPLKVSQALDPDSDEFQALRNMSKLDQKGFKQALATAKNNYRAQKGGGEGSAMADQLTKLEEKITTAGKPIQPVIITNAREVADALRLGQGDRL